jgi:hypothetical protein
MAPATKLTLIKLLHTLIWLGFNVVIGYLLFAVIANQIGVLVWIAIGLIVLEGLVLLAFGNQCPLTVMARRYSSSTKANFDIFLPEWLAKYNKQIYTVIFLMGIGILVYRLATN